MRCGPQQVRAVRLDITDADHLTNAEVAFKGDVPLSHAGRLQVAVCRAYLIVRLGRRQDRRRQFTYAEGKVFRSQRQRVDVGCAAEGRETRAIAEISEPAPTTPEDQFAPAFAGQLMRDANARSEVIPTGIVQRLGLGHLSRKVRRERQRASTLPSARSGIDVPPQAVSQSCGFGQPPGVLEVVREIQRCRIDFRKTRTDRRRRRDARQERVVTALQAAEHCVDAIGRVEVRIVGFADVNSHFVSVTTGVDRQTINEIELRLLGVTVLEGRQAGDAENAQRICRVGHIGLGREQLGGCQRNRSTVIVHRASVGEVIECIVSPKIIGDAHAERGQ